MSSFQKPTKPTSTNTLDNHPRSARGLASDSQLNSSSDKSENSSRIFPGFLPPLGPPGQFPVAPFFPLNMFGNQGSPFDAAPSQQQNSIKQNQNNTNNNSSSNISSQNAIDQEAPNPGLLQFILQHNQLNQQQAIPNILLQHALLQKQQQQQQQQQAGPYPEALLQLQQQIQQQQQFQQQQQQIQQSQQQQQPISSFSSSQLIQHLSRLNNPILLQQLYNTVTNPYENARFQSILLRLQQNAAANALANGNSIIPHNNNNMSSQQVGISQAVSSSLNTASQNIQQKLIQQQKQKEELTNMLEYLVERMHQVETDEIFEKKREFKFIVGEDLSIFDNIVHKYQFSKKTKEEMIKYILRKCFKFLKSNIKQQEIVGQKDIEVAFTRKYFGGELESQQQLQIQNQFMTSENQAMSKDSDDSDDEKPQMQKSIMESLKVKEENIDQQQYQSQNALPNPISSAKNLAHPSASNLEQEDIIEKVMPFKQGSKIKTMNIQFLKMIFHSEIFAKDYQLYLDKFEELAQKENQKKVQKCVKNLQDFIEKGQINKVKSYKRLPWLRIWLKETYELAKTLCVYGEDEPPKDAEVTSSQSELKKKVKTSQMPSCSKGNIGEESGANEQQQQQQQPASQFELNNKEPSEEQILEPTQDTTEWKTPSQVHRSPQRNSQTDVQRSPQRSSQTDTTSSEKDMAKFDIPKSRKSAELIQSETSLLKIQEPQERIKREEIESQGDISPSKARNQSAE